MPDKISSWQRVSSDFPRKQSFFLYFFDSRDSIIIAEVNADEDRILAERFEIAGFPTLKFFPAGAADAPEDYEGGRTAMDLVRYTNEKIGIIYYNNIN